MSWPSIVVIAVAVAVDIMLVPAAWLWDRLDDLKEKERQP